MGNLVFQDSKMQLGWRLGVCGWGHRVCVSSSHCVKVCGPQRRLDRLVRQSEAYTRDRKGVAREEESQRPPEGASEALKGGWVGCG